MSDYSRQDYDYMARLRIRAFVIIAQELGKDHPITKMMGSRSYGRHPAEQGPCGNLRSAVEAKAHLDGAFDVLNLWALANDRAAQRVMLKHYPRCYAKKP